LWIDPIAHVAMGHDKRTYRFVQDTRYGRKVLAESLQVDEIADAVTHYVASRLIERERAFASGGPDFMRDLRLEARHERRRRRWRALKAFMFGLLVGFAGLFAFIWLLASR
jgi:hypothetical protein